MATLGWSVRFYTLAVQQLTDPRQQDSSKDTKEDAIDPALRDVC